MVISNYVVVLVVMVVVVVVIRNESVVILSRPGLRRQMWLKTRHSVLVVALSRLSPPWGVGRSLAIAAGARNAPAERAPAGTAPAAGAMSVRALPRVPLHRSLQRRPLSTAPAVAGAATSPSSVAQRRFAPARGGATYSDRASANPTPRVNTLRCNALDLHRRRRSRGI